MIETNINDDAVIQLTSPDASNTLDPAITVTVTEWSNLDQPATTVYGYHILYISFEISIGLYK